MAKDTNKLAEKSMSDLTKALIKEQENVIKVKRDLGQNKYENLTSYRNSRKQIARIKTAMSQSKPSVEAKKEQK